MTKRTINRPSYKTLYENLVNDYALRCDEAEEWREAWEKECNRSENFDRMYKDKVEELDDLYDRYHALIDTNNNSTQEIITLRNDLTNTGRYVEELQDKITKLEEDLASSRKSAFKWWQRHAELVQSIIRATHDFMPSYYEKELFKGTD